VTVDHTDLPSAGRERPDPAAVLQALRAHRLDVSQRDAQVWVRAVALSETLASPTLSGLIESQDELARVVEAVENAFRALNGHARPC